jgi:Pentapeptide repeats (8 copies)
VAIGGGTTFVLALMVVLTLALTGGAKALSDNAALIGALVALGGVFTTQLVSIALDDRRTQESRDLEAQRAHEATLQNYVEQVGTLLIEKPLHRASPSDNLSTVVRALTVTALKGLDPDRKRILLRFLHESGLIDKDKPVVSLAIANLSKADLKGANLSRANLSRANLTRADLSGAELVWAYLSGAYLSGAYLRGADLRGADLRGANLRGANLKGANLIGANLIGARGITSEQLEQQAETLEGAIMPDGSKHS